MTKKEGREGTGMRSLEAADKEEGEYAKLPTMLSAALFGFSVHLLEGKDNECRIQVGKPSVLTNSGTRLLHHLHTRAYTHTHIL